MAHAWLDSLSDDWPSQNDSDNSHESLPPLLDTPERVSPSKHASHASRIPLRSAGSKPVYSPSNPNSSNVLIERSANEINMPRNRPSPSKLSHEIKPSQTYNRVLSNDSDGSVVHNKTNAGSSPHKEGETPEWKRRLVYGELGYGEQKDLFCSAATGLQDMFKPPVPKADETNLSPTNMRNPDDTMPSSPPLYEYGIEEEIDRLVDLAEAEENQFPDQVTPSPSPRRIKRGVNYRATSGAAADDSEHFETNLYEETPIRPKESDVALGQTLAVPSNDEGASRHTSGQSVVRNENFSSIIIGKQTHLSKLPALEPEDGVTEDLHSKLEQLRISQSRNSSPQIEHKYTHSRATSTGSAFAGHVNPAFRRSGDAQVFYDGIHAGIGVDTSEMLPEESLQASTPKEYPSVRTYSPKLKTQQTFDVSPELPNVPFSSPQKGVQQGDNRTISGSPLKLFGPYDTFTNQTLLRRISQFEDVNSASVSEESNLPNHRDEDDSDHHNTDAAEQKQSISFFGDGQLDGFAFTADITGDGQGKRTAESLYSSPGPSYPLSTNHTDGLLRTDLRAVERGLGRSLGPAARISRHTSLSFRQDDAISSMESLLESKRPRTSPVKDPTPKRRRTLHRSDIAYEEQDNSQDDTRYNPGKKRKDALPGEFQLASPDVLAAREILEARSPTPPRHRQRKLEYDLGGNAALKKNKDSPRRHHQSTKSTGATNQVDRKPSIRTQDFVDQAAQIMAMIRNQVKPNTMESVQESEEDNQTLADHSNIQPSHQESTFEPFDRPPSREGRSTSKQIDLNENAELVSKLKRYREFSDVADIISSSMRSMSLAQRAQTLGLNARDDPLPTTGELESDIPNIKLSANPDRPLDTNALGDDYPTNSSDRVSSDSAPTLSSRGSDSKRIIHPDTVSHLIPNRVGSMYLDTQQNIWIKKKESGSPVKEVELPSSPHEESSEDDPFAHIPDLSVDLTKELQHLKKASGAYDARNSPGGAAMPRMVSNARSELAKLGETGATPEQFATKSAGKRRNTAISFSSPVASFIQENLPEFLDSFEQEEASHNRSDDNDVENNAQPSRPTAGGRNSQPAPNRYGSVRGADFVPRPVSPIDEGDEEATVELPWEKDQQLSIIGDQSLIARRTPDRQTGSLSLIINGGHNALTFLGDDSLLLGQNVGMMSLSPLSEFTLNQPDQSFGLEVSYLVGQRHVSTGDGSKRVMSMTIRDLVDRLSEVEPCEPYWEDLRELDLHEKRLTSLHMLDEFCSRVVSLDASSNALGHLEGVPQSVRQLKVSENKLTELTSWDHLMNLQYVDISGNEIKSLSALKHLVHLRSLRADNNQIASLDGIGHHDGLLSLRARDNVIEDLDFEDAAMDRLTELDLVGNSIRSIRNLELLPCLARLKLSQNNLESFALPVSMPSLRHLDISDNNIVSLDVSNMPNLHTLHADRNQLSFIEGLHKAKRLDSLSLREQRGGVGLDLNLIASACEIRKLYLSGNYLGTFKVQVDMLNLQLLELANCGLSKLPKAIGQQMPNLRTLNVNFNAIANLAPLRFIPRLKNLLAAGNRLVDSTSVTKLLIDFPHLSRLDVRDNPMTLGYYAPSQALVLMNSEDKSARFTLPDADEEHDMKFSSRLDEATRLRRRLHQVVLAASCKRLRMLDGLQVRRKELLAMDTVLVKLIEEGMLPDPTRDDADEGCEPAANEDGEEPQSSRWQAENSFA